jgi:hypothetical protein
MCLSLVQFTASHQLCRTKHDGVALTLHIFIREELGSNLGRIKYRDRLSLVLLSLSMWMSPNYLIHQFCPFHLYPDDRLNLGGESCSLDLRFSWPSSGLSDTHWDVKCLPIVHSQSPYHSNYIAHGFVKCP